MAEEKKSEEDKDDVVDKVKEFTLSEIEKAKSRKSLFETFDIDPLSYTTSVNIKETFSQQYFANDERQAKVLFKINRVVTRLDRYLVSLQMILESGRVTDEATKEMAKELIIYYSSIISSLLMSYKSIAKGIYNIRQQNYSIIPPTNEIPSQRQQQQ